MRGEILLEARTQLWCWVGEETGQKSRRGEIEALGRRSILCCQLSDCSRSQFVVPFTAEGIVSQGECIHLRFRDDYSGRVLPLVQLGFDTKPRGRSGVSDEVDDSLKRRQRLPAPVLGDVAEQAMLYLVPLACSGRKVTDTDTQVRLVGELLQLELPCA